MIQLFLSLIIFSVFLYSVIKANNGVTSSISLGYYGFKETVGKVLYYLSYLSFCWLIYSVNPSAMMFWACAMISLVGVALDYKAGGMEFKIHMFGASVGIGLAVLSIGIDYNMWWLALCYGAFLGALNRFLNHNAVFWSETAAFLGLVFIKLYLHWGQLW